MVLFTKGHSFGGPSIGVFALFFNIRSMYLAVHQKQTAIRKKKKGEGGGGIFCFVFSYTKAIFVYLSPQTTVCFRVILIVHYFHVRVLMKEEKTKKLFFFNEKNGALFLLCFNGQGDIFFFCYKQAKRHFLFLFCLVLFGFGCRCVCIFLLYQVEPRNASLSLYQPENVPQALRGRDDSRSSQVRKE